MRIGKPNFEDCFALAGYVFLIVLLATAGVIAGIHEGLARGITTFFSPAILAALIVIVLGIPISLVYGIWWAVYALSQWWQKRRDRRIARNGERIA